MDDMTLFTYIAIGYAILIVLIFAVSGFLKRDEPKN